MTAVKKKIGVEIIFNNLNPEEKRSKTFVLTCSSEENEYEVLFTKINHWVTNDRDLCVILESRKMVLTIFDSDFNMFDEINEDYIFENKVKVIVKLVPKREQVWVSKLHFGFKHKLYREGQS